MLATKFGLTLNLIGLKLISRQEDYTFIREMFDLMLQFSKSSNFLSFLFELYLIKIYTKRVLYA